MEIKNNECPFCMGVAFCLKNEIAGEATRGKLNKQMWRSYIKNMRTRVLPVCLDPEGLEKAIVEGEELWKSLHP